jgi:hypothetical protein
MLHLRQSALTASQPSQLTDLGLDRPNLLTTCHQNTPDSRSDGGARRSYAAPSRPRWAWGRVPAPGPVIVALMVDGALRRASALARA